MNNKTVYNAICEIDENQLNEYDENCQSIKKRRKAMKHIITVSVCFAVTAVTGICLYSSGALSPKNITSQNPSVSASAESENETCKNDTADIDKTTAEDVTAPEDSNSKKNKKNSKADDKADKNTSDKKSDTQIITGNTGGQKGSDNAQSSGFCIFWWKNKLKMYGNLYWAIEDNPNGRFSVIATYRPTTGNITSFTYEGKTLAELAIAADNEKMMTEKMTELLKLGEYLKYGTALYKTGTPSGVKWDKNYYEGKVAYFGEEMLSKYIVNGEFLSEALKKDIADFNDTSARSKYKKAYNAYLETVIPAAVNQLSKSGIKCERAAYTNNGIAFIATAKQLENIPLNDLMSWYFDLDSGNLKGASENFVTDSNGLQIVN